MLKSKKVIKVTISDEMCNREVNLKYEAETEILYMEYIKSKLDIVIKQELSKLPKDDYQARKEIEEYSKVSAGRKKMDD
jgi:hypothetical protein